MEKGRIAYWDNLKFALIILVVLGHFFTRHPNCSHTVAAMLIFINSFHMPLFFFVSGLFHNHNSIYERCIFLLAVAVYFKILLFLFKKQIWNISSFSMLQESGMPWFLLALLIFTLLMYGLKDCNPVLVLVFSVVLGCLAGYDPFVTHSELISRVVVWFPFYCLGATQNRKNVYNWLKGKEKSLPDGLKWGGVIFLNCFMILCLKYRKVVWKYWKLIIPTTLYSELPFRCNGWTRLIYYFVVCAVGLGFLVIIPSQNLGKISRWGKTTLQVYIYHIFVRDIFEVTGIAGRLCNSHLGILMYILISIFIVILLSQKVFSIPTDLIRKNIYK